MKEILDHYFSNTFDGSHQAIFKFKQFEQNYHKYFPTDTSLPVLDIGVGRGEMLRCMKDWGFTNFFGVDISPSTISYCQSIGLPCQHVENAAEYVSMNKGKYGVITLLDVLEHIPRHEMYSFVSSLKQGLMDGGILIIQTPNMQSPESNLHRYNDMTHEFGFSEHSLNQLLVTVGFSEITFGGFEDIILNNYKKHIQKVLRSIFWRIIRFTRLISNNVNPEILNPVFFAVVKK